jgi:hypothetical protein
VTREWLPWFQVAVGIGGFLFLVSTVLAYVRYLRKWWLTEKATREKERETL